MGSWIAAGIVLAFLLFLAAFVWLVLRTYERTSGTRSVQLTAEAQLGNRVKLSVRLTPVTETGQALEGPDGGPSSD